MTDQTTDTTADEAPADEQVVDEATEQTDAGEQSNENREAAKYRRRLREAEKARDGLATRLETMQRGEAEKLAGAVLADGADLWRDGVELAGLLDDEGNLDPGKVTAAAAALGEAHPHWRQPSKARVNPAALKSGTGIEPGKPSGWSKVIRGRED